MNKLIKIYQDIKDGIGYFLKLFRKERRKDLPPSELFLSIWRVITFTILKKNTDNSKLISLT